MPRQAPATRRQLTLLIAVAAIAAAVVAAALLPVPYVILSPGPTLNTLGTRSGKPLIVISGHRSYPTNGHLNMVTVSYQGGPSDGFNLFTALQAWLSPHEAVVPESELFGTDLTQQQVTRQDTQQMVSSQQLAQAAALCQLRIPYTVVDTVAQAGPGTPAAGVLKPGDVITSVDGKKLTCRADAGTLIRARQPGAPVRLTVDRHGAVRQFRMKKINIGNIGGPSAGLMFALGIMDKLTPGGGLTGGRFVAGTGEISANGAVSPIGGIQQKMAGARAAGATVFLTPAANCPDTAGAVPQGMRLIKVSTLASAVSALKALRSGGSVPSC